MSLPAPGQGNPEVLPAPKADPTPPPFALDRAPPAAAAGGCEVTAADPPPAFTASADYLFWFIRGRSTAPSLVSANSGDAPVALGVASNASERTSEIDFRNYPLSGARISLGYWFQTELDPVLAGHAPFRVAGVDVTGFVFGQRSVGFQADSSPVLLRPFFDLNNDRASSLIVAAPGVASGTVFGSTDVQLWGVEANYWQTVCANPPGQTWRVDVLAGFRFLHFDSALELNSETVYAKTQTIPELMPFAGNRIDVSDSFRTANDFYGGQVGVSLNYILPCMTINTSAKLGIGDSHQRISISGDQVRTLPGGATTVSPGGLYALASNSGTFERDRIGLVPEFNFEFLFPLGQHLTFHAGYTLLGWSHVARPGAQIDQGLDITQIPNFPGGNATPTNLGRPGVPFRDEFLFVHGLNVGFTVVW